jgi:uncharacterized RDD family membrane protein YckC
MESIDILTGQHVTIKYEPAGIIRRGCALLLDIIVMVLYSYIIIDSLEGLGIEEYIPRRLKNITFFIIFLPVMCYHFFFETLMGGRTPGKVIAGTRVTNLDGSTPGLTAYFLRWLLLPVDLFPTGIGIGGLFIAFSKNHQRLGDLAAGTVVVRNVKPPKLNMDTDFREFSDDYQPVFRDLELLSDGQIRFITYILYDPRNKRAVTRSIQAVSLKVKELLKIHSPLDDRSFLETIVRDYNYYAWKGMDL